MKNKTSIFEEFAEQIILAILDENGNYIYVSKGWEDWLGLSAAQVLSRNVLDFVPDSKAIECLKTGQTIKLHRVMKGNLPCFTTYAPRYDHKNKICGVFIYSFLDGYDSIQEITHQLELLNHELRFYKDELAKERGARYHLDNIIGNSKSILQMKQQIIQAAKTTSTVLIEGETGTGKELIAHSIHAMSPRRTENFVRVNCAAIPTELMESEFFGYTAGSFTGALKKGKVGHFEMANHGTIFLDEINQLSPIIQPKFLRVLQEHEISPVGCDHSKPIDVRVIAATNTSLEQMVADKQFRSDLYYRLNVIRIVAPPLRDRMEDFEDLTNNLIGRLNRQLGMHIEGVAPEVFDVFKAYDWPGNVRELQNVLESAMNMARSSILELSDFQHLIHRMQLRLKKKINQPSDFNLRQSKLLFEKNIIESALAYTKGNRKQAAILLGISRADLYKRMNQLGIH